MKRLLLLLASLLIAEVALAQPGNAADAAAGAKLARQALQTKGFTVGTAGPLIVAFEDPNCRFCNQLSKESAPLIAAGKLRVHVVLVAFLKPDSEGRAAGILQSADPAAAWEKNEAGFNELAEEGGYPVAQPSFETDRTLRTNLDNLKAGGQVATPTLLVCKKGQSTPSLLRGIDKGQLATVVAGAASVTAAGGCAAP
ncbi:thioredoxin fold domain-containing protein [Thiomonas sp. FB-6]|uniref:thioredoxin fold domain-containing protein n=1 Tax=Thiomonas sp. FB-6 TaxID=1158291 RepID=UPI00037F1607|nr:thioredoxin fold domain-containing protein [Thiomonas sp. FB-6]